MSRRLSLVVAAVAVAVAPTARALPPTPLTTVTASKNVSLVSNFPAAGVAIGGKFAGKYYFLTSARAATYGTPDSVSDGGLFVFDVSKPETPSLVSHLPLPIWENEDVDLSLKRKILLISADRKKTASPVAASPNVPGMLFVYDISDMSKPTLKSAVAMPAQTGTREDGAPLGGPGHIANCILDCNYAYVTGSRDRSVHVVDLRDASAPKVIGKIQTPAGNDHGTWAPGIVHDVNVDSTGHIWMTGSGGTALYAPVKDPLKPKLLASTSQRDNVRTNSYIHHNSIRLSANTVMVTEESYNGCGGEEPVEADDPVGGRFETWRIDLKAKRLVPIAVYSQQVPGVSTCSSHWFDINANKIVADAWYEGGVRFLDVSNPKKIRQVGYLRTSDGSASQAQFVPGRPDLVYVADYLRGLDVIKLTNGGRKAGTVSEVEAPVARTRSIEFAPSEDYGYACPVPLV